MVRPILRFTGDRIIQLDGFEAVLSAILVHKTAHERMVVVSGTIWILDHRTCLRAICYYGAWIFVYGIELNAAIARLREAKS